MSQNDTPKVERIEQKLDDTVFPNARSRAFFVVGWIQSSVDEDTEEALDLALDQIKDI